jgi:hypothetical protein
VSENQALVDYYTNLLIIQYHDKPKAIATAQLLVGELMIYDTSAAVRDGFNIDTAVGVQLDIIAKYVGVHRVVTGTTFSRAYFGFSRYGDVSPFTFNPFIRYGAQIPDVQFRSYKESQQSLYALTDEEMRTMIKLAIIRNSSNGSVKDIDEIIDALFGTDVYFDDAQNMTVVTYLVGPTNGRIFNIARSEGLLPNPAGVGTSVTVVPDINNIFAFSRYGGAAPSFAVGFGRYPKLGEFTGIGGTSREWRDIASDLDGNIWASVFGGDIYKCPAGSTTFTGIGGTSRNWGGITSDPDGNIWATVELSGDIYKCLAGSTTFTPIGGDSRDWRGITSDPDGNIWAAVYNGYIYKCDSGTTMFYPVVETSRGWQNLCSDSLGNIWASVYNGYIYKCDSGTTMFYPVVETSRGWIGITNDIYGNMWATVSIGDIYKSILIPHEITGCMATYPNL